MGQLFYPLACLGTLFSAVELSCPLMARSRTSGRRKRRDVGDWMHQSQEQGRSEREKFQLDSEAVYQIVEPEPAVDRLGLGGDAVRQFGALAGVALASWFLRGQMISLIFQGMQNAARWPDSD